MENTLLTPEVRSLKTDEESPPAPENPQVMTEPSFLIAAKAPSLEKISLTPEVSEEETDDESPPEPEFPHVTTEPSSLMAAKA